MQYSEIYEDLKKAFLSISFLFLLVSCNSDPQSYFDEFAPLHPAPQIVALNIKAGYSINPLTGDSIKPIINSLGDTLKTGVPVPARGKVIDPGSVAKPKVVPAGKPEVVPSHQNVHKIPENLTVIPVNNESLKTFTPGVDTSSFVLVNSTGDTIPTGVPIPARGKVVPCIQPQLNKALPPFMNYNTSINMKYLDVEQGMTSFYITSILEDSRGNIWLGTLNRGVSMYNGETFTHFTRNEGLSGNWIMSILEDSQGNIWFCTCGGVSMYNGETFTNFTEQEGLIKDGCVMSILEDSQGNFWFGTWGGVNMYNGESFTHFTQKDGLIHNTVFSILEDSQGNIWFGTRGGLSIYNGNTFTHLTQVQGLINNRVWSILEDSHGIIWVGTDDGVSKYDGESFTYFTKKEGLCDNHIRSILEDSYGNLWFGTQGGVSMYNGETFTNFTQNEGLIDNSVSSIMQDSHGNLWFGTAQGGVSIYYGEGYSHFTQKEGLSDKDIISMLEDSHGNFWFSTWGSGVNMYNGETITYFTQKEGLIDNIVESILEDSQGNIWFGTNTGLCKYNGETFTNFTQNEGLSGNRVLSILEDSHGNLWLGTWKGGVSMYNGKSFTHFTEKEGLSNNHVTSILEDSHGNLWFCTAGRVSMYNGETFTHFTEKEGLCINSIVTIQEDSRANLWFIAEGGGVIIFNGETFTHYTQKEGLNRIMFHPDTVSSRKDSSFADIPEILSYGFHDELGGIKLWNKNVLLDSKNRIWWNSKNGLTILDINNFKTTVDPPVMQLNQIEINGQFIDYRHIDDRNRMKMEFDSVARFNNYPLNLELPYNHNHLTFYFSAIDWSASQKLKYIYLMEDFDDKWNAPTEEASVAYRNMPHGRYTFKVRAIGAAQKWSEPFEYTFRILPPLWLTWWAYMIYGFIILLLVRWYRGFLIKREKINADLRIKEVEVNKMQELDHMKSRFFANISHEFRTPLTLIQGPIEELKRDLPDLPVEKTWELLQFMKRNTVRLQHLINQILDISKLETGKVELQVSEGNLEQFIRTIILSFLSLAESKKIEYRYDLAESSDIVFFDSDKLEKILTNLISNAFKFTAEGGKIRVSQQYVTSSTANNLSHVLFEITDTGRGVPREKLERIFDRFYQVSDSDSRDAEGTGLGLALTKELVDLYRGEISVDSQEGKGSTFTVKLPVIKNLFTEEEIVADPTHQEIKPESIEPIHDQQEPECFDVEGDLVQETAENKPVILIVEDNADLRNYISQDLENNYRILTAINGKTGLDKAVECIPDLIISDVMMPEMDGMEMSNLLKRDERTNHIPVIMLTAKADRDSKLEGLETGADDYLIKPFDREELSIRIKNLLEQNKRLREKFRNEFSDDIENIETSPEDKFYKKVHDILQNHIEESEYTVEQLAGDLNLSRSQVFRKVMAVTSFSPNELLRNLRLKKAAILFQNGHKNVAQVMYQVGFNNPSYFAKCFNELFGMNPSHYIRKGN